MLVFATLAFAAKANKDGDVLLTSPNESINSMVKSESITGFNVGTKPTTEIMRDIWVGSDFDQDGKKEIILASYGVGGKVYVYEIDGDNSSTLFFETADFGSEYTTACRDAKFADLDGNGMQELLVSINSANTTKRGIWVYEYDTVGDSMRAPVQILSDINDRWYVENMFIDDVDGDGVQEIMFGNNATAAALDNFYIASVESGTFAAGDVVTKIEFTHGKSSATFTLGGSPYGAVTSDIDGNGKKEVLFAGWDHGAMLIVEADAPDTYTVHNYIQTDLDRRDDFAFWDFAPADLDADGRDEVYLSMYDGGALYCITCPVGTELSAMTTANVHKIDVLGSSGGVCTQLGDWDNNGKMNIYASGGGSTITVHEYQGGDPTDTLSWVALPSITSASFSGVFGMRYAGDLDGDGCAEIYGANTGAVTVAAAAVELFIPVPDLFFSEYIEGSSNNKALEIFNGSEAAVSLDDYRIAQSVNGGGWAYWHIFPAGATLAAGDVWVIITDQTDTTMFAHANADEVLAYPSVVHHNGDDARAIEKRMISGTDTTWIMIDLIGDPDVDPGDGWDVAGVTNATKDHTLIRKSSVVMGNLDWVAEAGTDEASSEWVVKPQNTFEFLGFHDVVAPEIAGIVAISTTQVQVRFSEVVDATAAMDVTNYSIDGNIGAPTAITMPRDNVVVLTHAAITTNTLYNVTISNIPDAIGNVMSDAAMFRLEELGTLPIDKVIDDFEANIGAWKPDPTFSGLTSGIKATSSVVMSDSLAYEGLQSAKMTLLDDPAVQGGWFIRELNRVDQVKPDSKLFLYLRGADVDVQVRLVIWDNGTGGDGYEAGPWNDITITEDDWQVISLDLANDEVTAWITGNGAINSRNYVTIESIQLQCKQDISPVLFFDLIAERPNVEPVDVTFEVDMAVWALRGTFNPAADFVDVAGSFNDWGGTSKLLNDFDGDSVYTTTLTGVYPGEELHYKFRINGVWNDNTAEFPYNGPERVYTVPDSNSVVYCWYNDEDMSMVGIDETAAMPKTFVLHQNYPNPFNPVTTIKYEIPQQSMVRIVIYDLMGKEVRSLVNHNQTPGYQSVIWDATDNFGRRVSSGYYIYVMNAGDFRQSHKMLLLK